jgi:exopolyphosphatase/guanosine-5'-triphosphate,3'-diphosphate pyrophosphatase
MNVDAEIIRRAAFDFGSGKMKLQVADVDTKKHLIVQSIYAEAVAVPLSKEAASHPQGFLSKEIQQQAIETARNLKQKAIELGAVQWVGLATEAYRKASNGQELIDRYVSELNIPVTMISQEEEGKMGFLALVAETGLDPSQVVSWDIGTGSFQIAYFDQEEKIQLYMAPLGRITTKSAIIQFVKGEDPLKVASPNPMSVSDWENSLKYLEAVLPPIPDELVDKLKTADVQLIGISAHPEKLRKLKTYDVNDVKELSRQCLYRKDSELAQEHTSPQLAVSELALVYSIMHKLNASIVNYMSTTSGSSSAILIEEKYWNEADRGFSRGKNFAG